MKPALRNVGRHSIQSFEGVAEDLMVADNKLLREV